MDENDKQNLNQRTYCPPNFVDEECDGQIRDGTWRAGVKMDGLQNIRRSTAHRALQIAYNQRDILTDYLLTPMGKIL
ncbi:hypothetical protein NQ314_016434 [Rhamnusium bicolor]|uniref:Uncharacterized protein n=1 Tax=Rhamnusium bicolor TaxID=1586634 RepID=A0AAV8WVN3_9CUCU|nr:hypothetical protein NQ314_016434 [Rhamnusium bicolor]